MNWSAQIRSPLWRWTFESRSLLKGFWDVFFRSRRRANSADDDESPCLVDAYRQLALRFALLSLYAEELSWVLDRRANRCPADTELGLAERWGKSPWLKD